MLTKKRKKSDGQTSGQKLITSFFSGTMGGDAGTESTGTTQTRVNQEQAVQHQVIISSGPHPSVPTSSSSPNDSRQFPACTRPHRKKEPLVIANATDPLVVLQRVFGLSTFRHPQSVIIQAVLRDRDVFVLLPTGGGKSLTFQLPALMNPGVTIVISPLLALIDNQLTHLRRLNIPCEALNSTLSKSDRKRIMDDLEDPSPPSKSSFTIRPKQRPRTKLLYLTPEAFASERVLTLLTSLHRRGNLTRLVVDEAHCISEWGHEFRPEYRRLSEWKARFPTLPVTALTATAIPKVVLDIKQVLGITGCMMFSGEFRRPNLYYGVRSKPTDTNDPYPSIVSFLRKRLLPPYHPMYPKGPVCGIIYCSTRQKCDDLSSALQLEGIKASSFHSGQSAKARKETLANWSAASSSHDATGSTSASKENDKAAKSAIDVIVATIAFGMGIDKPNVRFVLHHDMPKSVEGYYQESGRAGRDGHFAECILYTSREDMSRQVFLAGLKGGSRSSEMQASERALQKMVEYCTMGLREGPGHSFYGSHVSKAARAIKRACRHAFFLAYFGRPALAEEDNEYGEGEGNLSNCMNSSAKDSCRCDGCDVFGVYDWEEEESLSNPSSGLTRNALNPHTTSNRGGIESLKANLPSIGSKGGGGGFQSAASLLGRQR